MRILIWGTEKRAGMYYSWLAEREEVVGFIDNLSNGLKEIRGLPVIAAGQINELEFDRIVLVVEKSEEAFILQKACELSVLNKIVTIDEILADDNAYLEDVTQVQLGIIQEILNADDASATDEKWMYDRVIRYGIHCFYHDWYKHDPKIRWNVYGLQQIPWEFAKWCADLGKLENVSKAIEIGVYRGRSAYFMCAVLMRKNMALTYEMVDIVDRLDHFESFMELLPGLQKRIPSSSAEFKGQQYDFVFIDADHSYDASITDYRNVGQYAVKVVGFHDIYGHEYDHENGGTVRTWQEVCLLSKQHNCATYTEYPDRWMGIGTVYKGEKND